MKLFSELVKEVFPIGRYLYCGRCKTECIDDCYIFGSLMCPVCKDGYVMHRFLTMDELKEMRNETP